MIQVWTVKNVILFDSSISYLQGIILYTAFQVRAPLQFIHVTHTHPSSRKRHPRRMDLLLLSLSHALTQIAYSLHGTSGSNFYLRIRDVVLVALPPCLNVLSGLTVNPLSTSSLYDAMFLFCLKFRTTFSLTIPFIVPIIDFS